MPGMPHYLLLTATDTGSEEPQGKWQFLLHRLDRAECAVEAGDIEPYVSGSRLELLAVVRGLEALGQPSRVTLVSEDRYVTRGLRFGIHEWRANGWRWERFGRWVSVKHVDLWQRMERALLYHQVRGRNYRLPSLFDGGDEPLTVSGSASLRRVVEPLARSVASRDDTPSAEPATSWQGGWERHFAGRAISGAS